MANSIRTCGDIREFLTNIALAVSRKEIGVNEARSAVKAMEKITENMYAEIKAAHFQIQIGKMVGNIGEFPVNGSKDKDDKDKGGKGK